LVWREGRVGDHPFATLADVPAERACQGRLPSIRCNRPHSYSFIVADRDQSATVRREKQRAEHGDMSSRLDDETGCAFRPGGGWTPNVCDCYRFWETVLGSH